VPYDSVPGWAVVVPVKALAQAKTRLGETTASRRTALARAFAVDTVAALTAACAVTNIVVVSGDMADHAAFRHRRKVTVLPEEQRGMNPAVRQGAAWIHRHRPSDGVAVFVADLPAATATAVDTFLDRAGRHDRAVLADLEMVGSTALTALTGRPLEPAFGTDSLRRHIAGGAALVEPDGLDTLRRDVDVVPHLEAAVRLGVGTATSRVVEGRLPA
jgi:2-phospho-L-lactate guanylyltransferase